MPWSAAERAFPQGKVAITEAPFSKHREVYAAHRNRFKVPGNATRVLVLRPPGKVHAIPKPDASKNPLTFVSLDGEKRGMVISQSDWHTAYEVREEFDWFGLDLLRGFPLLVDQKTHSIWQGVTGLAISGPRKGERLNPILLQEMPPETARGLFSQ